MGFLDNAGLGVLWNKIVGKSIPYGYCTTGAGTRAKVVTVSPAITELTAGVQVAVKFQYANTASTTSSAVTLNVNGLGAKEIKRYGSTNISNSGATSWNANSVVILTYDGTYWQLTDFNNTTYSSMTEAEITAGTGTTARIITPARLKTAIQTWDTEVSWTQEQTTGTKIASITIDGTSTDVYAPSGGMSRESDPVFTASPAYGITSTDITNWNSAEANVQANWNESDSTSDAFIQNKPSIPTVPPQLGIGYGTCSTQPALGSNLIAEVTISNFTLAVGGIIAVKFVYGWFSDRTVYMRVNGDDTTYKPIFFKGGGGVDQGKVNAGDIAYFVYDGTNYNLLGVDKIVSKVSELQNDSSYLSTQNLSLEIADNCSKYRYILYVNGSSASLLDSNNSAVTFFEFAGRASYGLETLWMQVLNSPSSLADTQARLFNIAEVDMTTASVRMTSVDNGVIYTANLQDTGNGLTGTFSSQTIGTLTTETDPTVPSWAKASTKPSYDADEIGFDNTQQVDYITSTDVNGALKDLDYALLNVNQTWNSLVHIAGAETITGSKTFTDDTIVSGTGKVLNLKSAVATNSPILRFQRGELNDNYNDWQIQDRGGYLYFDERGNGSTAWTNRVMFDTTGNISASKFGGYTLAGACAKAVDTSISAGSTSTNLPTSQAVASFVEGKGYLTSVSAPNVQFQTQGSHYLNFASDVDTALAYLDDAIGNIADDCDNIAYGQGTVAYALTDLYTKTLPSVTSSDNGKVLRVVNGAWSAVSLPSASGVSF